MRDESNLVNMTSVQDDVVALYEAGKNYTIHPSAVLSANYFKKNKMFVLISFIGPAIDGTDENVYVNIFSLRNFVHLNEVAILFESTYGMSLSTVATTEFEGNEIGNALVSICNYNF
jgi:hypothetical protein